MRFVRIVKEGLSMERGSPWEKSLHPGKQYLVSDLILQQLSYMMPEHIAKDTVPLERVYKPYNGENLNGKTLLVWRHGGIGDLLFMMVPLRLLKVKYPECKIAVALGGKYLDLYKHIPYVDEVYQLPFDIELLDIADYHLHFEQIIEGNPRAEYVNAYDLFLERFGFNPEEIPASEKIADIFLNDREIEWAENEIKKHNIKEDDILIGIQLAASSPIRTFPDDKTSSIAQRIVSNDPNGKVILFGSPAQLSIGNGIKETLPAELKNRMIVGPHEGYTLRQSIAIARHCDIMVAPDSAMIHIAGALRVPIIGLYGPFPAQLRMRDYYNALALNACPPCAPCFTHDHDPCAKGSPSPCFSLIEVEQVMFAIELLLEKTGSKSLKNVCKLRKNIFDQVEEKARPYMKGNGIDVGCGFKKYGPEFNITRIDVNPIVDPDVNANFVAPDFEVDSEIDYIISSYGLNTPKDIAVFMDRVDEILKVGGYLILYIGDKNIIQKGKGYRLPKYLQEYLKSTLDNDTILETMKHFDNYKLECSELPHFVENDEPLINIFDTSYGIFQVWRKENESRHKKITEEVRAEVHTIEEPE